MNTASYITNRILDNRNSFSRQSKEEAILCNIISVPTFDVGAIVNIFDNSEKEFIYFSSSDNNYEFVSDVPIARLVGNSFKILSEESSVNNGLIEQEFIKIFFEENLFPFPIVLGTNYFENSSDSETWDDFDSSNWFIPKALFFKGKEKCYLLYNCLSTAEDNSIFDDINRYMELFQIDIPKKNSSLLGIKKITANDYSEWESSVNKAINKISTGDLYKIVLSRKVDYHVDKQPKLVDLINTLGERFPECYKFAYKKGNSLFFGASPEKLAKITDSVLETDALAGSMERGNNDISDKKLADALLNSAKNRNEQEVVVNYIVDILSNFSSDIDYPEIPIIKKLRNIQHLWTPIKAKLKENVNILNIVSELHPTPAICGVPAKESMKNILALENYSRGLYSGFIGWYNFQNEGEFAVGLRSALLKNNKLSVFAGCGIVNGSEALSEYEETSLKLRPILNLFDEDKNK